MELGLAAHVIEGMRATLFHNPTAGHKATKDDILAAMKLPDFDPTANRLDDESYGNRDRKQVAEIACEKDNLKVLIPVKHPSQKAVGK